MEGAFFGNVFKATPEVYFCKGPGYYDSPVPGRIGSAGQYTYTDPFTDNNGKCAQNCSAQYLDPENSGTIAGYKTCFGYSNVITIWR